MKKLVLVGFAVALALSLTCGVAMAEPKVWTDLSWWGKSGATPAPVKDATRSGYWWWPTEAKSNANDSEAWGNRGVVYAQYAEEKKMDAKSEPPKSAPPAVKREAPVLANVLFDFDKAVLKAEGKVEVDKAVKAMKDNAKDTLVIEGHTCNIGADAYNMGLGQRRADAVKKYMVDNGVDTGRIETKSYGETKPAVPNDTPANRKQNRRAVFVFTVVD